MKRITDLMVVGCLLYCAGAHSNSLPLAYHQAAQLHNVPPLLLLAISHQESNAKLKSKRVTPWPWTINHRGKPYYFISYEDAVSACQKLHDAGDWMFDVGFNQVNWYWNGARFNYDCRAAFVPKQNLLVSAAILREARNRSSSWQEAVGRYHSPSNKIRAQNYSRSVFRHQQRIAKQWDVVP
ncbi:lytic transglycosylase domain-containing protein [Motilimonas pumila]|uniref:Lytic transglycosylase domain-containing protein n=1 Tax=Motilimonas pumila TaxID=2303987 RepID=A0A418YA52_9GAMM|nr:lytic transglycosylase domain-containing protein [Motilimonas pumila]RJG38977.1 lytic transglycosylase domain-containing protein [Motilimonas pumila]